MTKLQKLDGRRKEIRSKKNKWLCAYFLIPAIVILGVLLTGVIPLIMIVSFMSVIISHIIFTSNFTDPFIKLTEEVKESLLAEFMRIYHPSISHKYFGKDYKAGSIIQQSNLISADRYNEEDAITGTKGNAKFYLSEIELQEKYKTKNGSSYRTILKGLLFKIKLKGRSFPKSQLYSQPDILKRWFGTTLKNEEYGFWYDTQDEDSFQKEIQSLFPFIRHLSKQGKVLISANKDEITILLESKMKFLDDPKFSMSKSFEDEDYYIKMSQQMNSLLYIIDSFTDELTPVEIEEELKLRVLEYAEGKLHR